MTLSDRIVALDGQVKDLRKSVDRLPGAGTYFLAIFTAVILALCAAAMKARGL